MDVKKTIAERFYVFLENIKSKENLTNSELERKLFMHRNQISNFQSSKQTRLISAATLYWAQKIYNANALYMLCLSDEMYLNNIDDLSIVSEPKAIYETTGNVDKIRFLEQAIKDKDEIIFLQKEMIKNSSIPKKK